MLNGEAGNRNSRGTSPMPFKRYDKLIKELSPGEYMRINQLPQKPMAAAGNHRRLRNALIIGGLGAAAGAAYRFQQPLMKLGHSVFNYARDKFHNLSASPSNTTNSTIYDNQHDA